MADSIWAGQVYIHQNYGVQYQILARYQDYVWYLNMSLRDPEPQTSTVSFFEQRGMHLKYDLEAINA